MRRPKPGEVELLPQVTEVIVELGSKSGPAGTRDHAAELEIRSSSLVHAQFLKATVILGVVPFLSVGGIEFGGTGSRYLRISATLRLRLGCPS